MYVNKLFEGSTGRTLLLFQETKRVKGKNRTRTVERIGYLDELEKIYDDPIAHFKEEAKRRSVRQKLTIEAFLDEHHRFDTPYMKGNPESRQVKALGLSLGMLPLSQIYHELEIGYFWDNRRRYTKAKYNHNTIFQALVFGRILFPGSKLSTWRSRQRLLSNMDFTDDDVYRSLPFFASHKTALQKHLHQKVSKLYGRDTSLLYYDVTNYYWETDNEDERRKRGVSKEHRPEPIIQMGLLMDSNDLPISYGLFSGNTNDSLTLSPMMGEVDETLKIQGVIYIADGGVISGDNRVEILVNKGGYIFSNPISKTDSDTKAYILNEKGYVHLKEGEASFKYKERVIPTTVKVTNWATGKKKSVTINERQIVFWGEKYQERARRDRQTAIEKALKYGSSENRHGGNKYFKNTVVNKADGQIIEEKSYIRELDEALLESDEELDGYYLICTNVIGTESDDKPFSKPHRFLPDNLFQLNRPVTSLDIIDMYRGLWRIEESFRITKSFLKTRPIFVRQEESIEAHFLSCFVSLLILRILELKTGRSIELGKMIEDLRNLQVVEETDDVYLLIEPTNIIKAIGDAMDLDLVKVRYTAQELKKLVAKTRR